MGAVYEKYNAALRAQGGNAFLRSKFEDLCRGNVYTTTLHAINSCIIKLSRLMKAGRIYRGSTRAKLPAAFLEPNELGIKGGVEYGFTSTTTEREQAVHYAQGAASTLFEMEMGMIDRGADVSWLSQYAHESESASAPARDGNSPRARRACDRAVAARSSIARSRVLPARMAARAHMAPRLACRGSPLPAADGHRDQEDAH